MQAKDQSSASMSDEELRFLMALIYDGKLEGSEAILTVCNAVKATKNVGFLNWLVNSKYFPKYIFVIAMNSAWIHPQIDELKNKPEKLKTLIESIEKDSRATLNDLNALSAVRTTNDIAFLNWLIDSEYLPNYENMIVMNPNFRVIINDLKNQPERLKALIKLIHNRKLIDPKFISDVDNAVETTTNVDILNWLVNSEYFSNYMLMIAMNSAWSHPQIDDFEELKALIKSTYFNESQIVSRSTLNALSAVRTTNNVGFLNWLIDSEYLSDYDNMIAMNPNFRVIIDDLKNQPERLKTLIKSIHNEELIELKFSSGVCNAVGTTKNVDLLNWLVNSEYFSDYMFVIAMNSAWSHSQIDELKNKPEKLKALIESTSLNESQIVSRSTLNALSAVRTINNVGFLNWLIDSEYLSDYENVMAMNPNFRVIIDDLKNQPERLKTLIKSIHNEELIDPQITSGVYNAVKTTKNVGFLNWLVNSEYFCGYKDMIIQNPLSNTELRDKLTASESVSSWCAIAGVVTQSSQTLIQK